MTSRCQTIGYHSWKELKYEKLRQDFESSEITRLYSNEYYNSDNFCIKLSSIIKETFHKNVPFRKKRIKTNDMQP